LVFGDRDVAFDFPEKSSVGTKAKQSSAVRAQDDLVRVPDGFQRQVIVQPAIAESEVFEVLITSLARRELGRF